MRWLLDGRLEHINRECVCVSESTGAPPSPLPFVGRCMTASTTGVLMHASVTHAHLVSFNVEAQQWRDDAMSLFAAGGAVRSSLILMDVRHIF